MDTIYDLWLADRRLHRRPRAAQRGSLGPIASATPATRTVSIDPAA